jgi:hypothetical protein
MLKFAAGVIVTLLVVAVVGTGLFFGIGKPANVTSPIPVTAKPTINPTAFVVEDKTATASSDSFEKPGTGFVNPSATIDAIETSLKNKVYTNLSPYMTGQVIVTLAASECCGSLTKEKTIQQLTYLNEATQPWDFSATNQVAKQLVTADPKNFKDAVIGTTSNRYTAAFLLNEEYLIEKIYISPDYNLTLGN